MCTCTLTYMYTHTSTHMNNTHTKKIKRYNSFSEFSYKNVLRYYLRRTWRQRSTLASQSDSNRHCCVLPKPQRVSPGLPILRSAIRCLKSPRHTGDTAIGCCTNKRAGSLNPSSCHGPFHNSTFGGFHAFSCNKEQVLGRKRGWCFLVVPELEELNCQTHTFS